MMTRTTRSDKGTHRLSDSSFIETLSCPEPNSGCWLWLGEANYQGYGRIRHARRGERQVHRLSYMTYVGPIPIGMKVLHRCDVPACVNPHHLWIGTNADNMADMSRKKRGGRAKGEACGAAKLTEPKVTEIRRQYATGSRTLKALAHDYGVDFTTVHLVVRRKSWAWVA